jgi:hypothetical protein
MHHRYNADVTIIEEDGVGRGIAVNGPRAQRCDPPSEGAMNSENRPWR